MSDSKIWWCILLVKNVGNFHTKCRQALFARVQLFAGLPIVIIKQPVHPRTLNKISHLSSCLLWNENIDVNVRILYIKIKRTFNLFFKIWNPQLIIKIKLQYILERVGNIEIWKLIKLNIKLYFILFISSESTWFLP